MPQNGSGRRLQWQAIFCHRYILPRMTHPRSYQRDDRHSHALLGVGVALAGVASLKPADCVPPLTFYAPSSSVPLDASDDDAYRPRAGSCLVSAVTRNCCCLECWRFRYSEPRTLPLSYLIFRGLIYCRSKHPNSVKLSCERDPSDSFIIDGPLAGRSGSYTVPQCGAHLFRGALAAMLKDA